MKITNKRASLQSFMVAILTVILFIAIIFSAILILLGEKNPSSELLGNKYNLNKSVNSLNSQLAAFSNTSASIQANFQGSKQNAIDYLFLIFAGAFEIPKSILIFMFSGLTIIPKMIFIFTGGNIFGGIVAVIFGLIEAVLITIGVLTGIKAIRTGETER